MKFRVISPNLSVEEFFYPSSTTSSAEDRVSFKSFENRFWLFTFEEGNTCFSAVIRAGVKSNDMYLRRVFTSVFPVHTQLFRAEPAFREHSMQFIDFDILARSLDAVIVSLVYVPCGASH